MEAAVPSAGPLESSQASSAAESHREIAASQREIAGSKGTSPHRPPSMAASPHRPPSMAAAALAGPSKGVSPHKEYPPTVLKGASEGVTRAQVATAAEAAGDTGGNGCEGGGHGGEGRASGDSFCGGGGAAASAAEYAGASRKGLPGTTLPGTTLPGTTQVSAPTQTAAGPTADLAASHASQSLTVMSVEAFAITKGSMVPRTARRTSLSTSDGR